MGIVKPTMRSIGSAFALMLALGVTTSARAACEVSNERLFDVAAGAVHPYLNPDSSFSDLDALYEAASSDHSPEQKLAAQYTAPDNPVTVEYVFAMDGGPDLGSAGGTNRMEISAGNAICVKWTTIQWREGAPVETEMLKRWDRNTLMLTQAYVDGNEPGSEIRFTDMTLLTDPGQLPISGGPMPSQTSSKYINTGFTTSADLPPTHASGIVACVLTRNADRSVDQACTTTGRTVAANGRTGPAEFGVLRQSKWRYLETFKALLPVEVPTGAIDFRVGGGSWHSQTVSAALMPAQKKAANALFAQGFDLYKGGDFVGAQTLIDKGLETDPANYLAWFTLGEINRAAWRTKGDQDAAKMALYTYQRVIDLAPKDSAQALLAANYLKPGGMN